MIILLFFILTLTNRQNGNMIHSNQYYIIKHHILHNKEKDTKKCKWQARRNHHGYYDSGTGKCNYTFYWHVISNYCICAASN